MSIRRQLARLAVHETAFLHSEFIAPHTGGGVSVRIEGVVCSFDIEQREFRGFGVFKPLDFKRASLVRLARQDEREQYLSRLPSYRMLFADGYGVLAHRDNRMTLSGPVPVLFAAGVEMFDTVVTRFDGARFLFDCLDSGRDPRFAILLRDALVADAEVASPGLTPEEKDFLAYMLKARREQAEWERRGKPEFQIRSALEHAGAVMRSWLEREDGYTVCYDVDGHYHTSFVDKNLRVRTAGICLTGRDADYDLSSLVSVLREGEERSQIVRVGVNRDYEDDD